MIFMKLDGIPLCLLPAEERGDEERQERGISFGKRVTISSHQPIGGLQIVLLKKTGGKSSEP